MTEDLIRRKILIGEKPSDIRELLGRPDDNGQNADSYKVVTSARCHFWDCSLDVVLDKASGKVTHVSVND
jgi:hypothetical protein